MCDDDADDDDDDGGDDDDNDCGSCLFKGGQIIYIYIYIHTCIYS